MTKHEAVLLLQATDEGTRRIIDLLNREPAQNNNVVTGYQVKALEIKLTGGIRIQLLKGNNTGYSITVVY